VQLDVLTTHREKMKREYKPNPTLYKLSWVPGLFLLGLIVTHQYHNNPEGETYVGLQGLWGGAQIAAFLIWLSS
jgi:hypothetical protein